MKLELYRGNFLLDWVGSNCTACPAIVFPSWREIVKCRSVKSLSMVSPRTRIREVDNPTRPPLRHIRPSTRRLSVTSTTNIECRTWNLVGQRRRQSIVVVPKADGTEFQRFGRIVECVQNVYASGMLCPAASVKS